MRSGRPAGGSSSTKPPPSTRSPYLFILPVCPQDARSPPQMTYTSSRSAISPPTPHSARIPAPMSDLATENPARSHHLPLDSPLAPGVQPSRLTTIVRRRRLSRPGPRAPAVPCGQATLVPSSPERGRG